jgi:hypothetical protein
VRDYLFRSARVRRRDWSIAGKRALVERGDEDQEFTAFRTPEDALIVAAGGPPAASAP